ERLFQGAVDTGGALPWNWATYQHYLQPIAPQVLIMLVGSAVMLLLLYRFGWGFLVGVLAVGIAISHFYEYRTWIFAAPRDQVDASIRQTPFVATLPNVRSPLPSRIVFGSPENWIAFHHKNEKTWRRSYVNSGGVDINMLHGISSISGYTPLIYKDYSRVAGNMHMSGSVNDPQFFSSSALNLLNVEYVLAPKNGLAFPPETFAHLTVWQEKEDVTVYRNPDRLGFFWPIQSLRLVSEEECRQQLKQPGGDFSKTGLLTESRDAGLTARQFGAVAKISGGFEKPTKIGLQVEAAEEVFLASAQPFYPGWVATVDGKKIDVGRVNGLFCGLIVPPGSHRVVLRFVPVSFWIGLVISLLSLSTWGALAVKAKRAGSEPGV
ncbi:MAG: hypothetical protein EHM61_20270, partial [Acidobacteria bacterium]